MAVNVRNVFPKRKTVDEWRGKLNKTIFIGKHYSAILEILLKVDIDYVFEWVYCRSVTL